MKILVKNKFWPIFIFGLRKICTSFLTLIIEIITLISLIIVTNILFFKVGRDHNSFSFSFSYVVIIFLNLLLTLFLVFNVIRIISEEIADGTFLILITKPYSRFKILFYKYLTLAFVSTIFIVINLTITLLIGYFWFLANNDLELLISFAGTIWKLITFSLFLTFFVLACVIFVAVILSPHTVVLLVAIFTSFSLLANLPISLETKNSDHQVIKFDNNSVRDFTVQQIKEILLFNESLKISSPTDVKLLYPNITKKIFDFYNHYAANELETANILTINQERINLYQAMGLYQKEPAHFNAKGVVIDWNNEQHSFISKNIVIEITFKHFFKTLELLDETNIYQKEVIGIIKKTLSPRIITLTKQRGISLLEVDINNVDPNSSKTFIKDTVNNEKFTDFNPFLVFTNPYDFILDANLRTEYDSWFNNLVYFAIQELDNDILVKVRHLKKIASAKINPDSENWKIYEQQVKNIQFSNYFSIFAHWSQMWTSFQGMSPFWFYSGASSFIDFDQAKNSLNSYYDFPIVLNKQDNIDINNISSFLNIKIVAIFYFLIACFLIALTFFVINYRDIS